MVTSVKFCFEIMSIRILIYNIIACMQNTRPQHMRHRAGLSALLNFVLKITVYIQDWAKTTQYLKCDRAVTRKRCCTKLSRPMF